MYIVYIYINIYISKWGGMVVMLEGERHGEREKYNVGCRDNEEF